MHPKIEKMMMALDDIYEGMDENPMKMGFIYGLFCLIHELMMDDSKRKWIAYLKKELPEMRKKLNRLP